MTDTETRMCDACGCLFHDRAPDEDVWCAHCDREVAR